MLFDPIVEEVRRVGHEIEAKCRRDPDAYFRHIRVVQETLGPRVIRRKPCRLTIPTKK